MPSNIAEKAPRAYRRSGLYALKRAVSVLGQRTVDGRSSAGRALKNWRLDVLSDLGGSENVSTMEMAIVDMAVRTKLILDSVDAWLVVQPSLVNKKSRAVLHAVRDRNALIHTLQSLLLSLGLKRRARELTVKGWLSSKGESAVTAPQDEASP